MQHAWVYEHLGACTCVLYVHSCVCTCMRVCTFFNTPPQVLKLASLALPPNIEKLPTHMSQAAINETPFETQNYFTLIP